MAFFRDSSSALACAALLLAAGCGGGSGSHGGDAEARAVLTLVGRQYGRYLVDHREQAPADEAAFRAYLESHLDEFSRNNVKTVDQLLNSPRDGKPLHILCGNVVAPPNQPGLYWAAYESEGAGGKRLAANTRGGVEELDAEAFAARIPQK